MFLSKALRISDNPCIAFVGAGGKTTAMFQLARELNGRAEPLESRRPEKPVLITATSHLGQWQIPLADYHVVARSPSDLDQLDFHGVTLITGPIGNDERTEAVSQEVLSCLHADAKKRGIPLFIEADGSRQKPLKAPAEYEPVIPNFVEAVVVVAGLSALGQRLNDELVHRPEIFARLSGLQINDIITVDALARVLTHPLGGLKNIPPASRRTLILNQADTPELQSLAGTLATSLLDIFDSVIVASLEQSSLQAFERTAGIILAAGESKRFGAPKQLLDWRGQPFIRVVAKTALEAGLEPVIVVTGANAEQVEAAVNDLDVTIARNDEWQSGQASSIRAGLQALTNPLRHSVTPPPFSSGKWGRMGGGAIFLLADQPQIQPAVLRALVETHAKELHPIVAPLVLEQQRANPVLFDCDTFHDLMKLKGDIGGRAIFSKHHIEYMPWHDDRLLLDVDKPEDYQRLIEDDTL
ncbi:MAG: putative selenium-dependent hydroxylase accessory protein YqeC [Chloroflexi bacterium]|nr:putative selenium-dependent hydroxylase accessory protein YqeC [Chloroflexota bacterium]